MRKTEFKLKIVSLSERIYPLVARMLGNNEDAQDAIQDIMLKLWNKRKKLKNHPNLNALVFLSARNHCLDILKKKGVETVDIDFQFKDIPAHKTIDGIEAQELNAIVKQILKQLPQQQSEIMIMRDIDGLEYKEIADATSLKVEHIRVLLSRAHQFVAKELKKIYCYE